MERISVYAKIWLGLLLATAVLAACTPNNEPTPNSSLAEAVTVAVTRPQATAMPQPSSTPSPTVVLERTAVSTSSTQAVPTSTSSPTSSPIPAPTATSKPQLIWSDYPEIVATFDNIDSVEWSPNQNELIYHTCEGRFIEGFNFEGSFFKATASMFEAVDLAQNGFLFCRGLTNIAWTPDGTGLIFTGPLPDEHSSSTPVEEFSEFWLVENDGNNPHPVLPGETITRWLNFNSGWLDESTVVYSGYAGGGHVYFGILNVDTQEKLAWAIVHLGNGKLNSNFIATNNGATYTSQISAAIVSTVPQHPSVDDEFYSPYLHHLSFDDEARKFEFYSQFQDWRPNSNEMLVLTWDISNDLFETNLLQDEAVTSLQLWNVENDALTMLIPDAVYGRFSPDGRFLLYLTPAPKHPIAHLYDWQNQKVIMEQLVIATRVSGNPIEFEMTFSPDGRFLTYFTPNEDGTSTLQIIDANSGDIIWQVSNPTTTITWSPTSEEFIYRNSDGNLALLTVEDGRSQPLKIDGGDFVSNPRWSYDGRYLSVAVQKMRGAAKQQSLASPPIQKKIDKA